MHAHSGHTSLLHHPMPAALRRCEWFYYLHGSMTYTVACVSCPGVAQRRVLSRHSTAASPCRVGREAAASRRAGKERTFEFLQSVLEEVLELFPSKYIHIGGDECPKTRWAECEACQGRIREQRLSGTPQLQTYFINRIAAFLRERGRCIIGWDEVLEGGAPEEGGASAGDAALAADAVVMSWRGTLGGITAAKHKHRVIMTATGNAIKIYFT